MISANQRPDHTTIARFRQRHEGALAKLFGDLLRSCADAGLVKTGVVAIDGTKLAASASHHWNRDYEQIAREARRRLDEQRAREAKPIPRSRPERLREAKRRLEEELAVERRANAAYEAYRAGGVMRDGRRFRGPAEALRAARHARREDQHDRPRLAQPEDPARLRAGLQRPGRDE